MIGTRMIGGIIMAGDDKGLRLPPRIAPVQVHVLVNQRENKDRSGPGEGVVDSRRVGSYPLYPQSRCTTLPAHTDTVMTIQYLTSLPLRP